MHSRSGYLRLSQNLKKFQDELYNACGSVIAESFKNDYLELNQLINRDSHYYNSLDLFEAEWIDFKINYQEREANTRDRQNFDNIVSLHVLLSRQRYLSAVIHQLYSEHRQTILDKDHLVAEKKKTLFLKKKNRVKNFTELTMILQKLNLLNNQFLGRPNDDMAGNVNLPSMPDVQAILEFNAFKELIQYKNDVLQYGLTGQLKGKLWALNAGSAYDINILEKFLGNIQPWLKSFEMSNNDVLRDGESEFLELYEVNSWLSQMILVMNQYSVIEIKNEAILVTDRMISLINAVSSMLSHEIFPHILEKRKEIIDGLIVFEKSIQAVNNNLQEIKVFYLYLHQINPFNEQVNRFIQMQKLIVMEDVTELTQKLDSVKDLMDLLCNKRDESVIGFMREYAIEMVGSTIVLAAAAALITAVATSLALWAVLLVTSVTLVAGLAVGVLVGMLKDEVYNKKIQSIEIMGNDEFEELNNAIAANIEVAKNPSAFFNDAVMKGELHEMEELQVSYQASVLK